ncbi:peptidoglycan-binding protein [Oecophyllibacter saccharovorans]|uniref:OmpA family protein n=1 Tax=Oecophyllibacter saccharovorans TaxID=2558360 RepID=UPI001144ED75|nr:OmpA family protein [Oecophyllibacter saccharovorans]QDH14718.1 peptidoglycan-binding protein [Oecophyllibacter saccharovorans]
MARRRRLGPVAELNAWPGYVDALSTLLMVLTFLLLFFVIGQQLLAMMLTQRQHKLDMLDSSVNKLQSSLAQSQSADRQKNSQLAALQAALADANRRLAEAQAQNLVNGGAEMVVINGLTQRINALTQQLQGYADALNLEKNAVASRQGLINDLDHKLAQVDKANNLNKYQSKFFAELSQLLKGHKGIEVAGDRFRFQAEILFPPGSDQLTPEGVREIRLLGKTLKTIEREIPASTPWVLQVEGYADRMPIHTPTYPSNWELSAARAITVVKLLMEEGINPHHLAATAFSSYQPLGPENTPEELARNRRIEFRITPP